MSDESDRIYASIYNLHDYRSLLKCQKDLIGIVADYKAGRHNAGGWPNKDMSPRLLSVSKQLESLKAVIDRTLPQLDIQAAEIVSLYFVSGFTWRQTAAYMHVHEQTVYSIYRRLKASLAKLTKDYSKL